MTVASLDAFLRPGRVPRLTRLGRDYDGGYLVDERSVSAADFVVSLGINDDWSFERDFRKANAAPIVAFDGTVGARRFLKDAIKSLPRLDKPGLFARSVRTYLDYHRFFGSSARHVELLVGMDRPPKFVSLATVFESHVPAAAKNVFLKVDIEGWEYRVLDDLVRVSDRLCGAAIELHDFDLHRERIRDFLARCGLNVCHVHCNNFRPLDPSGTPLVIELSLTKFEVDRGAAVELPNPLDMPNDRRQPDYAIRFR